MAKAHGPLPAAADSLEAVPEALRGHYAQGEGGHWVLRVEPVEGWALENVEGLRSALGKERKRAEAAEARLKAFGDMDPEVARRALDALAELGGEDPKAAIAARAAEQGEARAAELADGHAAALAEREAEIERLTEELGRQLVDSAAARALAEQRGSVELLLPHVRAHTRARRGADGALALEVVDADGRPRIGDAQGGPMSVEQLVAEMKASPAYARAFDGSGQSGGGAPANGPEGGLRRVSLADQAALNDNLQAIARGDIAITD